MIDPQDNALGSAPNARATEETPADWFRVIELAAGTYAISEPNYWQQNVSYLLVGSTLAVLYDTGPGIYSMQPIIRRLTTLPLLVIPSHLHFDHVGRIDEYDSIALFDMPALREKLRGDVFTESPEQYMLDRSFSFRVARWLHDNELLDLGGRHLKILHTPGHTPESVTLFDATLNMAFTGDLVNRMVTLCNTPGSDVNQTAASLDRLVQALPAGTQLHEGHAEAPITWEELVTLAKGAAKIPSNLSAATSASLGGQPTRVCKVGSFDFVLPPVSDERLRPLSSATQTLEWIGESIDT